jgi:hypothetical protein
VGVCQCRHLLPWLLFLLLRLLLLLLPVLVLRRCVQVALVLQLRVQLALAWRLLLVAGPGKPS